MSLQCSPCVPCGMMTIGTSFESQKWCAFDICGLNCASLAWFLHIFCWTSLYANFIYTGDHENEVGTASKVIFYGFYTPLVFMSLWSHLRCWTMDPGAVPMGAKPYEEKTCVSGSAASANNNDPLLLSGHSLGTCSRVDGGGGGGGNTSSSDVENAVKAYTQRFPRGVRRCRKCKDNFKPPRAHHDSVTGRCIVKLDHFCPWVGNAVGIRNHKCFLLFIFYTWLSTLFAGTLLIMGFARCGVLDDNDSNDSDSNNANVPTDESSDATTFFNTATYTRMLSALYPGCEDESHVFFDGEAIACIVIVCAVFIFTVVMMFDQYEAVSSNMSKIARMKVANNVDDDASDLSSLERVAIDFNEVFGGSSNSFRLHWLIPTAVDFPGDNGDAILGYELDEDAHKRGEPWRWVDPVTRSKRKAAADALLTLSSQRSSDDASSSNHSTVPSLSFADIHSQLGTQIMIRDVNVPSSRSRGSSTEVPSSRSRGSHPSGDSMDGTGSVNAYEFRRDDDDGLDGFNPAHPPPPANLLGNPQDDENSQATDQSQQQQSSLLSDYDKL